MLDLLHIQDNLRTITHPDDEGDLKVVAADTDTCRRQEGRLRPGRRAVDLRQAGQGRRDAAGGHRRPGVEARGLRDLPLDAVDEPPAGVFKDKLDYFRDVRDGKVEGPEPPVIYEFPKAMLKARPISIPNFYITNPNLGRSVSREWLEDELRKELDGDAKGPQRLPRQASQRRDRHEPPGQPLAGAEHLAPRRRRRRSRSRRSSSAARSSCPGIDGGGLDDLFGLTLPRPLIARRKHWLSWSHAWCHKGVLERRKSIASKLLDFRRPGRADDRR
jgi:hypothetical protein